MIRNLIVTISIAMVVVALVAGGCGDPMSPLVDYTQAVKRMIEVEGRYDDAIAFLEGRSRQFPRAAPTWYWLSIAYHKKGQYEQAIAAMDRAFSSDLPRMSETMYPSAYDYRGWAHHNRGNGQAALADFNSALSIAENADIRQDALRGRGWVRLRLGRHAEAIADFDQALPLIDSGNAAVREEALRGRGWARYYLGNFNGALQDATQAIGLIGGKRGPDLTDAHRIQAFAHLALGHDGEAVDAMEEAKAAGDYGNAARDMALMCLVLGQREKAFSLWGGAGSIGVQVQDYAQGDVSGARIVKIPSGSPAQAAGLMPGDIVLAIDQQPTASSADLVQRVKSQKPGRTIQVDALRNGTRSSYAVTVGSPEVFMASQPILAPVLRVRPIPPAPPVEPQAVATVAAESQEQTGKTEAAGASDAVAPVEAASTIAVESTDADPNAMDKTSLVVKGLKVEPQPVKAGDAFDVTFEVLVEDLSTLEMELELTVVRAITQDGKTLLESAPETLTVVNGEPKTIVKKMRASKTAGDYTFEVTLTREGQTARQSIEFRIE